MVCVHCSSRTRGSGLRDALIVGGVLALVLVLIGLFMPALTICREPAREKACIGHLKDLFNAAELYLVNHGDTRWKPLWLTRVADLGYCGALHDAKGRAPSDPDYDRSTLDRYMREGCVLYCPNDRSMGKEGGRPDKLLGDSDAPIEQYPRADVDPHPHVPLPPSATPAQLDGANRVPCSYLYEWNAELCDWLYPHGDSKLRAPTQGEFEGATWDRADVVRLCDQNGDGLVSWAEIRQRTLMGRTDGGLKAWGAQVPFLRCYWHTQGRRLTNDSRVFYVTYGGDFIARTPRWHED